MSLPESWNTCALADVTEGCVQRKPQSEERFLYVDIGSVDRELKAIISPRAMLGREAPSRARKEIRTDDVLVSMTRPNLNAVALVPAQLDRQIASTGFEVLRPRFIDPRWIYYLVRTEEFVSEMAERVQGALYPAVRPKDVQSYKLPLAPLNEQHRIADKLDAVLAQVDACRERLHRVPAILKRFRQSVLAAATSGKLTEDWREEHQSPRSNGAEARPWQTSALSELCEHDGIITYGVVKLGPEVSSGVPCLRTSNVRWLRIDTAGMKRIAASLSERYRRTILKGGEVLVNVRGTLGGVAVAGREMAGWNVSREIAVVPVDQTRVDPHFLSLWVASDASQRWLSQMKKGVAYVGINIEDLRNLPVELPSMGEQQEIVRRVRSLHAYADDVERRNAQACAQAEGLTPALLAKAFRGELVPQDPNDETASVLLERVRAERAVSSSKARRSKGGRGARTHKEPEVSMLNRGEIDEKHLSSILKERGPLTAEALWSASKLGIDDFYDQLKDEEARGLLVEKRSDEGAAARMLEAAA